MYGIFRTIILLFIVVLNKRNFPFSIWGIFVLFFSLYCTFFCDNPIRSFFGDIHIGGGALDIILTGFYPYFNHSSKKTFVYTVFFISILIVLGFGSEHKREISNGLFASASFISNLYIRFIFFAVSIYCRSRTATFIIFLSIFFKIKSVKFKFLLSILAIFLLIYESFLRFQYIDSTLLDSLTTSRFYQWEHLPKGVNGFDVSPSIINTSKYHSAFVDMRVASGNWYFSLVWFLFVFLYLDFVPFNLVFSFFIIQIFWYNSSLILFGWFFLFNTHESFIEEKYEDKKYKIDGLY